VCWPFFVDEAELAVDLIMSTSIPLRPDNPAQSEIALMRRQLDQLVACLWQAPTGDFPDTTTELVSLVDAVKQLLAIFEKLRGRDAQDVSRVAIDWAALSNELYPIAQGLQRPNTHTSNEQPRTAPELSWSKIKLIRCKLQYHATVLRVSDFGMELYGQSGSRELAARLAFRLVELRNEENGLASQIYHLERNPVETDSNTPSQDSRRTTQDQRTRNSWPTGNSAQEDRLNLQQDLESVRRDLTRTKQEIKDRENEVSTLKTKLAATLHEHNKCEQAADYYEQLYDAKVEEANNLRNNGKEGDAKSAERQSFRLGQKWVATLIQQQYSDERYSKAQEIVLKILEGQKTSMGKTHEETRASYDQYFEILERQADSMKNSHPQKSEKIYVRLALKRQAIWECQGSASRLDPRDKWRFDNGHELGLVLAKQCRYREAEEQHKRVWEARRTALPQGHDDIAESALQIAAMLDKQNGPQMPPNPSETQRVLTITWNNRGVDVSEKMLGLGHTLGVCLFNQRKYGKAETVLYDAWETSKIKASPQTISIAYQLSLALYHQQKLEKYARAKPVLEELWGMRKHVSNGTSLNLKFIGIHLAWTLYFLQDYVSAEDVIKEVLESIALGAGAKDPQILNAQHLLAATLLTQENYEEAEKIFEELWVTETADNRPMSAETLDTGHNLGQCRMKLKKYDLAREVLQLVYTSRTTLGVDEAVTTQTKTLLDEAEKKSKIVIHQQKPPKHTSKSVSPGRKDGRKIKASARSPNGHFTRHF
jgi:hypothetical protein